MSAKLSSSSTSARSGDPETAIPAILAELREGFGFEAAYLRATGEPLAMAESRFWSRLSLWNRWLPILASSSVLWIPVTLLALIAFRRRRARTAELMRRFEEAEEEARDRRRTDDGGWIH